MTTAPGQVTVAIGDVSGKGVAAALVMSRVATDLRRLAEAGRTPAELLAELSRSMFDEAPDDTFATAACLRLDTRRQRMTIANAGHVLPLRRRASGQVEPLRALGSPLGIHGAQPYVEEEFDLHPGDLILLMTDGVAEALECDSDPFAMERLCALVAQAPRDPAGLNARILEEVARAHGERRPDDVTLLALELA